MIIKTMLGAFLHIIIRWTIIEEEILGQDHKKVISEEEEFLSLNNSSNLGNGNLNFSRNGSMNNIHNVENYAKIPTTRERRAK